ncbi:MAG: DUF362 domain-containing protein [Actinobacteria bacterium]|nr:DUF362 domain-containing protein [Actinomycetota bacterium]
MSTVFFVSSRADSRESNLVKYRRLLENLDLSRIVSKNDLVAIKLSFGERGNLAYLRPSYIRGVVDVVKNLGGRPFLTDSNTLYVGGRNNSRDHTIIALENGFGYEATGAPIVIADGLLGLDHRSVPVNGIHFSEAKIATAALDADAIISLAHFKGHMICGFGGAIKNLGMGFGSHAGKRLMHSDYRPEVSPSECEGCARCREWCPEKAISMVSGPDDHKVAKIDHDSCIGCCECAVICTGGALEISYMRRSQDESLSAAALARKLKERLPENTRKRIKDLKARYDTDLKWRERLRAVSDPAIVQEKIAEYAAASLYRKQEKFAAINVIVDVTPDCDCVGWSDNPIVPNIGIAASLDPVSVDAASYDLVNDAIGYARSALTDAGIASHQKFAAVHNGVNPLAQLIHGEKIGLGELEYKLVSLDSAARKSKRTMRSLAGHSRSGTTRTMANLASYTNYSQTRSSVDAEKILPSTIS